MIEVTDKAGRRVTRADGVLQDGDRIVVPMPMMDSANPALAEAMARAEAAKRVEQFDASRGVGHKPGYSTQDAGDAGFTAREARDARVRDAWKNPPSVTTNNATAIEQVAVVGSAATNEQLFAARDQAIAARDKRTEAAWQH